LPTMEPSLAIGCLWFVVIAFMFFAQHHVCDAYFVPAINVFVEKMRKSPYKCAQRWGEEAVAGATICALGCNGPELFTNLISLYTGSDAGIGVVVGSEIFNLLIIVGCAVLAAPKVPLQIERVPFARDVFFYALSIGLLYWCLLDKKISFHESSILLCAAGVYVMTVYFTTDCVNAMPCLRPADDVEASDEPSGRRAKMHGVDIEVEEIVHGRMADGHNAGNHSKWSIDVTAHGIYAEAKDQEGENAKGRKKHHSRSTIGLQFEKPDSMLGPILKYEDLKEVVVMEMGTIYLEFVSGLRHSTLKITVEDADKRNELLANIERYSLGRPWVHAYQAGPMGAITHATHVLGDKEESLVNKLFVIPEFIIDFLLKSTLFAVDVKDIKKQGRWPLCFMGAMFWLGIFSWGMLEIADQIHFNIPTLPESFLGITVCAIGTSFPNAVASILMAQQNKPAAAIANALGSNVQNVFLAMALPWVIYSAQNDFQPVEQNVAGITEGVVWMMGTLILVVTFVLLPGVCTLNKCNGFVLIAVYLTYLVLTSGETFGWWPALIK